MRHPRAVFALAVLAAAPTFVFSATAPSSSVIVKQGRYWVETVKGSLEIPRDGVLRISSIGPVRLAGSTDAGLRYTLITRVKATDESEARDLLRRATVRVTTQSDATVIAFARDDAEGLSVEIEVSAPRTLRKVSLETHGGEIKAVDLDGTVTATTGGGPMKLERIGGTVEARTAGGDIEIGTLGGSVKVATAGGSIRAVSIRGDGTFETAGGPIQAGEVGGAIKALTAGGDIRIDRAGAGVSASTAGGGIVIREARGPVKAETNGGSIEIGSAAGVRCETGGGGIRLNDVSGGLNVATAVGNIVVRLARGRALADSTLSTSGGDITVYIPSGAVITIRAEGDRSGGARSIVSEFPGIAVRAEGPVAIAEGSLNGGGPLLRLAGIGGTIFIKKQE